MKKIFTLLFIGITTVGFSQTNNPSVSTTVVISQVYGGAGCGTAGCSTYKNDYIELYNLSASPIDLSGYSVQYASAAGTASWTVTPLSGTIQPGKYFLVAESSSANGITAIPTPDVTGTIPMGSTAGKVALVSSTTALTGGGATCPTGASIIDLVGYGTTANCFEGTGPAPAPSTTTADLRNATNTDLDQNSTDFTAQAPNPRNSAFGTLPITLQNFTANKNGNNTELHWQVNCLSTSVIFELQRSVDGANFQTFFTSSETKARCAAPFNYTEAGAIPGKNYYRLKIIDIDGKVSYSNIVLVANGLGPKGLLTIHPNIVTKQVDLYYTSANAEKMQWIVTDLQGRIVKKVTSTVVVGDNKLEITTADLTTGQYQAKGFTNSGSTAVIKFIKQ